MKKFNKRTIYIVLFAILYICVGLVSTIHAVSFFALANVMVLAVILALAFEVGQAAVLFSILTDIRKRKKVMPWLLMSVLTIVQILGNIYSSYKYLIVNSEDKLRYFKEPIFTWVENMPDQNANVLLVYIIGAILPIVSLLMTAMLTSYLETDKQIEEEIEEIEEEPETEEGEEIEEIEEEKPKLGFGWLKNKFKKEEPEIEEIENKESEPEEDDEKKLVEDEVEEQHQENLDSHAINL